LSRPWRTGRDSKPGGSGAAAHDKAVLLTFGSRTRSKPVDPRVESKKRRKAEYCTSMASSFAWTLPGNWRREWGVSVVRHGAEVADRGQLADLDEPALVEAC